MKYYVEVFRDEDNTKLLMMVEKQEISVPEEYYRFIDIWEALYVIDTERMAIKRVTDSYERQWKNTMISAQRLMSSGKSGMGMERRSARSRSRRHWFASLKGRTSRT